jgi:hypothetical protein
MFLAKNQTFPLIEVIPGLWQVDMSNAKYLGFWDKEEPGDEKYLKDKKEEE